MIGLTSGTVTQDAISEFDRRPQVQVAVGPSEAVGGRVQLVELRVHARHTRPVRDAEAAHPLCRVRLGAQLLGRRLHPQPRLLAPARLDPELHARLPRRHTDQAMEERSSN
eukprot:3938209-Rhodomonas_salina.1